MAGGDTNTSSEVSNELSSKLKAFQGKTSVAFTISPPIRRAASALRRVNWWTCEDESHLLRVLQAGGARSWSAPSLAVPCSQ